MATLTPTDYARRARYHSSADGFNIKHPAVPAHTFLDERDRALAPGAPTGLVACDIARALAVSGPATTPYVLARYGRIAPGDTLRTRHAATVELHYVIAGHGQSRIGGETLAWAEGDVFMLPGGADVVHTSGGADCALWSVTDEPALAYLGAAPPAPGRAPVEIVHYPADEIRSQLDAIHALPAAKTMTGKAVTFSHAARAEARTISPALTLAMNSLLPGDVQRPHRHNAVAVTLVISGDACHSTIGGQRVPWAQWATLITPGGEMHSHHNEGGELALFLIVQDGGLHYHLRTMGFSYA